VNHNTNPITIQLLPEPGDLLATARYVLDAWENPQKNVTYDLHEGMRRLRAAVKLKE
jgi:hypothetical protein